MISTLVLAVHVAMVAEQDVEIYVFLFALDHGVSIPSAEFTVQCT